jgi:hypothetical protein
MWWIALSLLLAGVGPPSAEAVTVPGDFPTIQSAINAVLGGALPNGTAIDVQPGQYFEALVAVNTAKSFTVRSAGGPGAAIINAFGLNTSTVTLLNTTGTIRFDGVVITGGVGRQGAGGGVTLASASPTFANCFIQGNSAPQGGGALLTGASHANFDSCVIQSNAAGADGGGAVIVAGSRPTFMNTLIQGNVSGASTPTGSGGGVHSNDASPTFVASRIVGNTSKFAGGGIVHIGIFGSPNGQAVLTLTDSEVSGNESQRAPGQNPAEGGGIHIEANALARLTRAKIRNNKANTGGGLNAYLGRYEVTSSIIEGNQAPDPLNVGGFGGGIAASSNNVVPPLRPGAVVILTDTVVRNNSARVSGGVSVGGDQVCAGGPCDPATRATLTIENSLIQGNVAQSLGGGMLTVRTNLTVSQSQIFQNQVTGAGGSFGGGLMLVDATVATITGTTISGNSVQDTNGGDALGGGLFLDAAGTSVNVQSSSIYENSATRGGGIFVNFQGPPTGVVQNSQIADNTGFQIAEQKCSGGGTFLTYTNNRVANLSPSSQIYKKCFTDNDFSAFNALTGGANNNGAPTFASFAATPDFAPSVLAWSVARKTSIGISPGVGAVTSPTGTFAAFDANAVAGVGAGTYTLTANPGAVVLQATAATPPAPTVSPFDLDGRTDAAIYRGSTGQWLVTRSAGLTSTITWGDPALGDIPVSADFDGDGNGDVAVYRGSTGQWFVLGSTGAVIIVTWGDPSLNDQPVLADFDGDGRADIAVYRGSTGQWFVLRSTGGLLFALWGDPSLNDMPAPADYDGDGRADVAVYRGSTGQWFVLGSTGAVIFALWGDPSVNDAPFPGKFDGDARADIAVYRATTGQWFVLGSTGAVIIVTWGDPSLNDMPAPADYDGDGRTDFTVYRPGNGVWFVLKSTGGLGIFDTGVPVGGDQPVPLKR